MNQWNAALNSMMTAQSHYRCAIYAGGEVIKLEPAKKDIDYQYFH